MKLKAVLFGSIGSFSETSRLQLDSFNESMKINHIDEYWDEKDYIKYLKILGGVNRLRSILSDKLDERTLKKIHNDKTEIFQKKILDSDGFIKPGFEAICLSILENNIQIALASTTSLRSIELILSGLRSLKKSDFHFIAHSDLVKKQKPDPQVYEICLNRLGAGKKEAVAFEDTTLSLKSSYSAGIQSIAIPGEFGQEQDFSLAVHIINRFSDIDVKFLKNIVG